jgi:hypothetical protein
MHAVSLIQHARCMRGHWHRMHSKIVEQLQKGKINKKLKNACGVNDTACFFVQCMWCHWYRMHNACGVFDIDCTMHARCLYQKLEPKYGFQTKILKSAYNYCTCFWYPYWRENIFLPFLDNFSLFWAQKLMGRHENKEKLRFYFGLRILLPIQIQLLDIENPKIDFP